jgi:hypothetical protein
MQRPGLSNTSKNIKWCKKSRTIPLINLSFIHSFEQYQIILLFRTQRSILFEMFDLEIGFWGNREMVVKKSFQEGFFKWTKAEKTFTNMCPYLMNTKDID